MANASPQQIRTELTELLGIQHPIMLAGMNVAAGPDLAAAVTNAGGECTRSSELHGMRS